MAKEEEAILGDRPVIPDTPYEAKGALSKMTWKQLLLGSVHNTVTGYHRRAEDMYEELKALVSFFPRKIF